MESIQGVQTLGNVVSDVIASKKAANRRPAYVRNLKISLTAFARGRESTPMKDVSCQHVEEWLASRKLAPSTRAGWIQALSVLFAFAIRRGYIDRNPCLQIERVSVDRRPPRILTPAEARKMVQFVRRKMPWRLAHVVLGLYAGIRPEELRRLYWRDIDLARGYVTINAAASKTRRRRIVNLDPKAIAWLKSVRVKWEKRQLGTTSFRWRRAITRHTGIPWSQDLLRHTAASFLLAKHGDAGKVARMLGNSVDVLLTHYYELVTPADCRRFWATPSTFWKTP